MLRNAMGLDLLNLQENNLIKEEDKINDDKRSSANFSLYINRARKDDLRNR